MSSGKRILQNFTLLWLDENSNKNYENDLQQLRSTVHNATRFDDRDQCLDFLTDIDDIKVFLVVNRAAGEQMISVIHDIPQLDIVYILDTSKDKQWTEKWSKIDGIHKEVKTICDALPMAIKQCDQDSIDVSFLSMENTFDPNGSHLEPSFVYTQIMKEIFLDMEPSEHSFHEMLKYWRQNDAEIPQILQQIDEFQHTYSSETAIRWYTHCSFVYEILNRALRSMDIELIMKMSFLICDLHQQLEALQQEQRFSPNSHEPFTVYRGQGLSQEHFHQLQRTQHGLISFNSFLSTSDDPDVSRSFAESAAGKEDLIGVLFEIAVDPSVPSVTYARIAKLSHHPGEQETLFSMHTVFRVGEITRTGNIDKLYQVKLTLISADEDEQLFEFNSQMRSLRCCGTGWKGLGQLLVVLNRLDRAERLYKFLLEQTNDQQDQIEYLQFLASIKNHQGDHQTAIDYLQQALHIMEVTDLSDHSLSAFIYSLISDTYTTMGNYFKAIFFSEKALEIAKKATRSNRVILTGFYVNIGDLHLQTGDYAEALSYYKEALDKNETLNPSPLSVLYLYFRIGKIYDTIGKYSEALSYEQGALAICEKILLPDHSTLLALYCLIGSTYRKTGQYELALSFHRKGLDLLERTAIISPIDLSAFCYNAGELYSTLETYDQALLFYQKGLEALRTTSAPNPSLLAVGYSNIGTVFFAWGQHSKAIAYFQKAVEIYQKTILRENVFLANCYMNIGLAYHCVKQSSEACFFTLKAIDIYERDLPSNHPDLATFYAYVGIVYSSLKDYPQALRYHEKAIEIIEQNRPLNHQAIIRTYNNISTVYYNMGDQSQALSLLSKASEKLETVLSVKDRTLGAVYVSMGDIYKKTGEHAKARSYYERAESIFQSSLPSDHPVWQVIKTGLENLTQ